MMQTAHLHTITNLRALKPLLLLLLLCSWSNLFAQTYNGTTWYSAKPGNFTIYTIGSSEFNVFPPSTGSITFTYQYKKADLTGWFPNFDVKIYCYVGGYGSAIDACSGSAFKTYSAKTVSGLNAEATKVKFDRPTGNTHNVAFSDIKLPMAPHIRLKSSNNANGVTEQTLTDFANTIWGTTCSDANRKTVYFRSFLTGNNNANANITITSSNPEVFRVNGANSTAAKVFNVGKNAFAYENGSGNCSAGKAGKVSNYTFNVYFHPTEAKEYTGTITITDGVSTAYVYVKGTGIKRGQTIQDFPTGTATAKTTDVIDFDAYTTDNVSSDANGLSVSYSSDNGAVATINSATGVVTIKKDGTVTFTAGQTGTNGYNSTSKSVTYTISKVTPTVTWPTINNGLIYTPGAKVEDHWTGGSAINDKGNDVDGDFSCTEELQPAKNASGYTVTFTPDNLNWYNSTSATIKKDVAKADQEITWGSALTAGEEYPAGTHMDATATSGLDVYYVCSKADSAFGYVNPITLELVVVQPNHTITIIAKQDGNANWNPAEPVSKTIVTCGTRPDSWNVSAADLTYGQALEESELTGVVKYGDKVITGDLAWDNPTAIPVAGNHADEYEVRFTPTGEDANAYSSIKFTVDITVHKATPVIKWNIGTNLRASSRYSNFFVSNSNGACTVTTSNNTLLSVSDNVLETGNVASATNGWIRVTQAATANYEAITVAVQQNVTVNPRVNVCLPFTMTQSIFNDAVVGSQDNVAWYNTNDDNYVENYIVHFDVTYTQRVGIGLGSWTEGLSGLPEAVWNWIRGNDVEFAYSDKWVDFSFTGVPDRISFDVESQAVTSSPPAVTWPSTATNWYLYESADGNTYTQVGGKFVSGDNVNRQLKAETRYIRIKYSGNFTGFIKNLSISQKKYLTVDETSLTFGADNEHPLQVPQTITMRYSSLGDCGEVDPHIAITSSNPAFYVDEPKVVNNVGIDYMGVYTVRVRCNDVNQSGTLTLASSDGTKKATVTLSSAKPELTTTPHSIFQTGTEHAPGSGAYRALATVDYSKCFNGGTPLFDTVYVYGVSASAAGSRAWDDDVVKGYKVPVINVEAGNVHTPCFVYEKSGTKYVHRRTFDAATTTLNISTTDKKKKLAFIGYKPASLATNIPAIQISGSNPASVYLNNTEMQAKGAVLALSGIDTIFARGTNNLTSATDATVKFIAPSTELIINDNWVADEISGIINLKAADGKPSIELKSANDSVIIRGSQLKLQKANRMAIARMEGAAEKLDGAVHIYDGTILGADGADTLGMPYNTLIDGGTFNNGTVVVYKTAKWKARRPMNSRGDLLARYTMTKLDLENQYDWYGQAHLTLDDYAKVHPMLFDTTICIFNGKQDSLASHVDNWNKIPDVEGSDVIIDSAVVITEPISVNMLIIREQEGKDVSVTIAPTGGLTVGEGGIIGATKDNLILAAGDAKAEDAKGISVTGQTGFLRIDPESEEPMPEATVELFSIAYYNMKSTERNYEGSWQYVGSPLAAGTSAKSIFTKSYIYSWDESRGDWVNNRASLVLQPFVGYATSQYKNSEGMLISYVGQLAENGEVVLPLTYSPGSADPGCNVLANSFTAPIDMTLFDLSDFSDGVEASIHLFNTGSEKDIDSLNNLNTKAINMNARGQYISVPVKNLSVLAGEFGYPTILPSMQGFYVNTSKAGTLTLNYKKLVWNSDYSKRQATPLRARQQDRQDEVSGAMCVSLSSNGGGDNMFLLESEDYAAEYENGYDSHKIMNGNLNVFAVADDDKLAVDATNSLIGTRVGVRTGEETSYTMSFSHLRSEDELALFDNETNETTDIDEGTVYTFYAEPNSEILGRFQIVGRAKAPSTPTGVNEVEPDNKVHKFIKDNQLYILKNGVLYNGMGAVVR